MKNGLLYKETLGSWQNIGDYVQSIAAEQFFDKIDSYIHVEHTSEFKSCPEHIKVIMNGWYMTNPENWPPSSDIIPLFISFHITPDASEKMLDTNGVEYLKKYAPIGCRDVETKDRLIEKGIPAYFSGCLTLTLGLKYKDNCKSGEVIFVDPYYEFHKNVKRNISLVPIAKAVFTLLCHYEKVNKISRNIKYQSYLGSKMKFLLPVERILRAACFYQCYKTRFTDELLTKAAFIHQKFSPSPIDSRSERFEVARGLIKRYAQASLVVTSRIHAALPCLALETPVLFTTPDDSSKGINNHSTGRFKGLIDLFRVLRYDGRNLVLDDEELRLIGKIGLDTKLSNKDLYKSLQRDLIEKCQQFVKL